ncbi:MAG: hypothetical protein WCC10_10795 [Tumebacillaceae bacterium]
MKLVKWTWKQWTALSFILLVLVISYLAYSVFVPKLKELEKVQAKLQKYVGEREELINVKVPKPISAEEKKALAMEVPVSLEQSRFIRMIRDAEQEAGVVINSLSFPDPNGAVDDKSAPDAKTSTAKTSTAKTSTAKSSAAASSIAAASTLEESTGKLLVSGDYQQVRKFFERFNQMERLVTFNKWTLSTEEVRDQTVSVTTRSVPVYPPNSQQATPATQTQTQSLVDPSRDDLLKAIGSLNRPLLEERTPLYTQQEFDRVVESVMAKLVLSNTQRDKDLANLEIQQATNRYQAGQEGKKEAVSIVDQEKTGDYVPGANTNIREVLLGSTAASSPVVTNQPGATSNANVSPLYFLNIPSTITPSNKLLKVVVKVEIDFTIYQAPGAKLVLPALDTLSEYKPFYEPTLRSNPVESN